MYELRVLCFGEKENYKSFHDYLVNLRNPSEVSNGALSGIELNRKLQDLLTEQERFQKMFPVGQRPTDFRQKLSQGVSGLKDKLRPLLLDSSWLPPSRKPNDIDASLFFPSSSVKISGDQQVLEILSRFWDQNLPFEDARQEERGFAGIASVGVLYSLCDSRTLRGHSLDVGVYDWHADGDPRFASNEEIKLSTAMAFWSFRLISDPRFDVADVAAGAGAYWFSSKGFNAFHGIMVQPFRFDFHAPTLWAAYPIRDSRRLLSIPSFRFGWMLFPAGFDAGAFGSSSAGVPTARIPGELKQTWALFVNLTPLLPRKTAKALGATD